MHQSARLGRVFGGGPASFQTGNMNLANLYTPEELAKRLKVSRRAVYQWLTKGKLVGMKAGQGWRITEEDLIAFMQNSNAVQVRREPK